MKFPTSDKIILRAAKRLAILEAGDKLGNDVWVNNPKATALSHFIVTCSENELRRIVKLSGVCLDYAYETLDDCLMRGPENLETKFNLDGPSDFAPDPRQISLFN